MKPADDLKQKMARDLANYGDLRFREGSAFALGDRETGRLKAAEAAKLLETLLKTLTPKPEARK